MVLLLLDMARRKDWIIGLLGTHGAQNGASMDTSRCNVTSATHTLADVGLQWNLHTQSRMARTLLNLTWLMKAQVRRSAVFEASYLLKTRQGD